jgi:hypothetical protein
MFTFNNIEDEDILQFFARLGYAPWKKYDVSIKKKNDYSCEVHICGKGNFIYYCTLTHTGLASLENFYWIQFLYEKYGEPYRIAFLETIDDEMFFIQEKWS